MKTFFSIAFALAIAPVVMSQAPAPTPPAAPAAGVPLNKEQEVEALYSGALQAFAQGKYDVALQKVGAIHTATNNTENQAVMYIEGACHYNLKQYDKAVEFFEKYVQKYPDAENVNEARIAVGECYLLAGNAEKGIAALKEAAAIEELFEKAGIIIASYYKKEGKPEEALPILEKLIEGLTGSPTQEQQQSILMASDIYLNKGETEKAQAVMEKLNSGANADDTVVQRNIMALKVGDEMLEQKRYGEALRAYQNVRRQSELLRLQKQRLARIEQWVTTLSQPTGVVVFMNKRLTKEEAQAMLEQNKKILEEIESVKDYDAGLFYRLGQCFYEMQSYYESLLAFTKIYTDHREYKDRDRCLFGMILCNAGLERPSRAMVLAEKYISEFPEGANYGHVTDMLAQLAVQAGDSKKAVEIIRIATQQKDADLPRLNFLLGVVSFDMQDFDQARLAMKTVLEVDKDKDSPYKDTAMYYMALSYFFQNDSVKFLDSADEYLTANPKGEYIVDCKYRKAFIKLQAGKTGQKGGDVAGARTILEGLVKDHENDPNIGQVWSLLGDIYGEAVDEEGKIDYQDLALKAYSNAVAKAKTADVEEYAIDAANGLMQEKQMWKEIVAMWTDYYNRHTGDLKALKAIHYIASARERLATNLVREGKLDEAKKVRDEARALVAKEMLPHLGNPANEQVEVLIQQLVSMMVPKKRPRAVTPPVEAPPAPTAPAGEAGKAPPAAGSAAEADAGTKPTDTAAAAAAAPAPAPPPQEKIPTFEEVEEEFKKLLTPEGVNVNNTASARILYGRALIAAKFKEVAKYENLISIIPDAAKAEELSPLLLATLGQIFFKKGDLEKASEYYTQIRAKHPNSEFGDRAPIGLADIEYEKKEYQKALDLYSEAVEKYSFSEESILSGSLGKAKCYLALLKWDEAEKLYTTILNTREWRIAHPQALQGLGDVYMGKKEYAKAIVHYRKILLAWRRDKNILFSAYVNCAKAYIANNDNQSARDMLEELLRQKEIAEYPALQSEGQQLLNRA